MSGGKLVLIIGPSGVGKSVILKMLKQRHPAVIFPKSATTRQRRAREGDDLYHFVSEDDFTRWLGEGKFLEWAQVHHAARYGTLLSEIIPHIDAGRIVVREVDVQGFHSIRKHKLFQSGGQYPLLTIFILPESEEQLIAHIQRRAPMEQEEMKRRLQSMRKELLVAKDTDVQITNAEGGLDRTIARVEEAILESNAALDMPFVARGRREQSNG